MNTNSIKKKLRSNRGASLSVALLLFLVCAVLGSVVLKTATAASGRLAGVEEADQRYYSVNSAADLIAAELDGQTVHIRRAKVTTNTYVSSYSIDKYDTVTLLGTDLTDSSTQGPAFLATQDDDNKNNVNRDEDYKMFFNGTGHSQNSLLISAAYRFLFNTSETPTNSAVWSKSTPTSDKNSVVETRTYELQHEDPYDEYLNVNVTQQLRGDGTLIFVISNEASSGDETYEVRLTFTPTLQNKTAKKTTNANGTYSSSARDEDTGNASATMTETETIYEYRYTAITWNLTETKKAGLE